MHVCATEKNKKAEAVTIAEQKKKSTTYRNTKLPRKNKITQTIKIERKVKD